MKNPQHSQKLIFPLLTILIFSLISCSDGLDEKLIKGKLLDKKYQNEFFSVQIPNNWEFLKSNEPDYIFAMKGIPFEGFSPNLLVLVIPKNEIKNSDGVNTMDEYFEMTKNYINNEMPDFQLSNSTQKTINEKVVRVLKIKMPEKLLEQNQYIFEVDDFYVNMILTFSENQKIDVLEYVSFRD